MQVNAGKLQILTVGAMLVLISGGIAAYAQGQSASTAGSPASDQPVALAGSDTNSTSTSSTNSTSTTTDSNSTTSTTSANYTLCQPTSTGKAGRLVLPITATGASTGSVSFANSRDGCLASITSVGGIFSVRIVLQHAKPVTQYNVVMVANGTSYTLGNLVTGPAGAGQMLNQVLLKPGTYVVSIQIYDTSSNPGQSTLVLQTGQGTIVSPPFPTSTSSSQLPSQVGQGSGGQGERGGHR